MGDQIGNGRHQTACQQPYSLRHLARTRLASYTAVEVCLPESASWSKKRKKAKKRQAIDILSNTETYPLNHYCSAKIIDITYCECVFVALGIQHAMKYSRQVLEKKPQISNFVKIRSTAAEFCNA